MQLAASSFGLSIGWRVALFVALSIGFPVIVAVVAALSGCSRVGGACGAVALVSGMALRPVIVVVAAVSLARPCWRRARTVGLPAFCGLLIPALLLADMSTLMLWGAHWSVAFSLSVLAAQLPVFALLAILAMLLLAAAPDDPDQEGWMRGAWASKAALLLTLLGLALKLAAAIVMGRGMFHGPYLASYLLSDRITDIGRAMALAALVPVAWLLVRAAGGGQSVGDRNPGPPPPSSGLTPMHDGFGRRSAAART